MVSAVHRLIEEEGVERARYLAATKAERREVDAAAAVLAEEVSRLGITHAGFAMTSLPHKRVEDTVWERKGYLTTLLVELGLDRMRQPIGVPFGPLARMILLYLQTEAIRTGSPEVVLGRSMNAWMDRLGISRGGKSRTLVSEQAKRISACRLTFFTTRGAAELRQNGAFVRDAISLTGLLDADQPSLWQDRVRLDEGFWKSLRAHPVPVPGRSYFRDRQPLYGDRYLHLARLSSAFPYRGNAGLLARNVRPIRRRIRPSAPIPPEVHRFPQARAGGVSGSPRRHS